MLRESNPSILARRLLIFAIVSGAVGLIFILAQIFGGVR